MKTVIITGANRGLGLEFCRQYSAEGWQVIATCRAPDAAKKLAALNVEVRELDTSDPQACQDLARHLSGRSIDILINNAGIMGDASKSALDADFTEWEQAFRTNVLGPVAVTRALLPNLKLAVDPIAVTMGSQAGIFDKMTTADLAIYRSTKAATHAVTISMSKALKEHSVLFLSLRPGRTRTHMTGFEGDYEVADSVRLMRKSLENPDPSWNGLFVDRSGEVYPYTGGFQG